MVAGTGAGRLVALDARLVGGQSTGDSTYWTGLIQGLANVPSDFRFLLLSNAPKPPGIPESDRFIWQTVPGKGRLWSLLSLPLASRRAGASALHVQYNLSPLAGKVGITTVHDVSFFIGPEWFRPRDRIFLSQLVPASVKRAARVITVSETSKSEIERYIPEAVGKIRVTHPAAHPLIQRISADKAREVVKREFGIEGPFLLTVGTRWPRKNMALALDAAAMLDTDLPHRLVVTGKPGWGVERLGDRALAVGYVRPELLSALYSSAALYLAPSRHEGFGIPVLEAMTCGCPVLSSAGGALPETVGEAGLVIDSWEPERWAREIEGLLRESSKLASMRDQGFERARLFTWEETARKTLEVYREIAL